MGGKVTEELECDVQRFKSEIVNGVGNRRVRWWWW